MVAQELAAAAPKEKEKEEQLGTPPEKTEDQKQGDKEKADEGKKKKEEEEEVVPAPKPPAPFVICIDLHCVGCAKKIEKSILKIRGVEGVSIEMETNQVTIKGVVEPEAVCSKLMKRTKRMARVISPLPAAVSDGQPIPDVVNSQVSGLVTVELNVNMHCEACAQQLKKKILKMRGVRSATTELSSEKVTVTGSIEASKLVDYVYRHTKKQAKIVPQPQPEVVPKPEQKPPPDQEEEIKKEEPKAAPEQGEKKELEDGNAAPAVDDDQKKEDGEKKEEELIFNNNITEEQAMQRMMYYYQPLYVMERIPPPQLFSDENPHACSIT